MTTLTTLRDIAKAEAEDVAERAKTDALSKKHLGITKPKYNWPKRSMTQRYTRCVRDINEDMK